MARTVTLPTLAHSSSSCWWYFLANLMNSRLSTLSPNRSRFWLTRGLILTTCPGLPIPPRRALTIDSAIVLAAFDRANEVTRRFSQAHSQDHEEAIEVSSEDTVLEGSDVGGHNPGGEEEERGRVASPVRRRGKTHKRANKAQERWIPPEFWENVPP